MKRHLIIFLCFLFLFISIPVSAFASTNGNYSYSTLSSIMDDYEIINNTRLFLKGGNGNYYCFESEAGIYYAYDSNGKLCYLTNKSKSWVKIWQFDTNNIYKEPSLIVSTTRDIPTGKAHPIIDTFPNSTLSLTFIACSVDVYDYDNTSEVVFTPGSQGTSQPGVTPPGQGSTPSQNQLLLTSVVQSTQLSQVLIEVVTILPILIPTCITFLSLRKGLRFLLLMLKQS